MNLRNREIRFSVLTCTYVYFALTAYSRLQNPTASTRDHITKCNTRISTSMPKSPSNNSLHGTQNLRRLRSTGRWCLQHDSDVATHWRNVLTSILRVEEVRKQSFNIGKVMSELNANHWS